MAAMRSAISAAALTIAMISAVMIPGAPAVACEGVALRESTTFRNAIKLSTCRSSYELLARVPALWENPDHPERVRWSEELELAIRQRGSRMLRGAGDISAFCPRYSRLDLAERVNVWQYLLSTVAFFESGFDPLVRRSEPGLGTDPVTGRPVYSEGLFQLSYQDILKTPKCEFDWQTDRSLDPNDPRKTILNPIVNLRCAVEVMERQIVRYDRIELGREAYWSTLKTGSASSRLAEIKNLMLDLPFCWAGHESDEI